MDDTFRIIALQKRIVSPRDRVFFSGFPWNPNPVISSGRYIVAGNGIVHSNGHRFPAGVGEAGRGQRERERRSNGRDDIANIWFDSGANVQGVCRGGARTPLSTSTGVEGSVRRAPITIWMFLPLVSLCQPPLTVTAPIYLEGIHLSPFSFHSSPPYASPISSSSLLSFFFFPSIRC